MKICFVDFWGELKQNDNYFYHLLRTKYNVEIDFEDPDIVFCSVYGNGIQRYANHRSKKVLFTGENKRVSSSGCDMTFSFDPTDGTNVYLPLWVLFLNWFNVPFDHERDISYLHSIDDLISPVADIDSLLKQKTRFCSFIVKNPNSNLRVEFCKHMQTRFPVDCPGDVLNNIPKIGGRGDQIQKIEFLRNYRFNIAFENSFSPGYVTEKIIQPMFVRCVPIYWGGTESFKYFNSNSFIWCGDCESMDQAVDKIAAVEKDSEKYVEMIRCPILNEHNLFIDFHPDKILNHLQSNGII